MHWLYANTTAFYKAGSTTRATPPVHFALVTFGDQAFQTIFLGWPQTIVLPISISQVAGIIGMSRWFPVGMFFLVDSFLPSECFNS
jgi:hypothetical protein